MGTGTCQYWVLRCGSLLLLWDWVPKDPWALPSFLFLPPLPPPFHPPSTPLNFCQKENGVKVDVYIVLLWTWVQNNMQWCFILKG